MQKISYDPFGKTRNDSSPLVSVSHHSTGQERDFDLGLYDYGARYYDPDLMRFISADPIAVDLNNPLKYTDTTGNIINVDNNGSLVLIGGPDSGFSGQTFYDGSWSPTSNVLEPAFYATYNEAFERSGQVNSFVIAYGGGFNIFGSGDSVRRFALDLVRSGIPAFGLFSGQVGFGIQLANFADGSDLGLSIDLLGHSFGAWNAVETSRRASDLQFRNLFTIDSVCASDAACRTIGGNVQTNVNFYQTGCCWGTGINRRGGRGTAVQNQLINNVTHSSIVYPAFGVIRQNLGIGLP